MGLGDRIENYSEIEQLRKRPLIVYATSTRGNVPAMMAGDSVREFIDQIECIPTEARSVDVLIHSAGGDALAAWKLMSVLRERFETVGVLVPFMAFSAATIFCLGADEIVMHPHASLGPIDPQIAMRMPDGSSRRFAFEDVGAFLRFISEEVGITEQSYITSVVEKLFSVVDPVNVGAAKRASELATDVGERLLRMHMKSAEERNSARTIAEGLNKSFFAHGDAVSRSRARELQLRIAADNEDLEKLLWRAYLGLEDYMSLRTPFNPLQHFLSNGGAQAIAHPAPLVLPPNCPPQLAQQLWQQVAQQAIHAVSQPATEVQYTLVNALVESTRKASEFKTTGSLSATRIVSGEIQLAATDMEAGWRELSLPIAGNA